MKQINIKCPYCNSPAFLRPASAVHGQEYRQPGEEVYVCARYPICDSYVSAHRRTHLPMGTLANRPLRIKRMEAHEAFNRLWKSGMMSRTAAYHWLQVQMGLPAEEAHIAKFSEWRCEQVIRLCRQFLAPNTRAA
ncbi:zinc-finger-containing protein [Oscillibacter sp.]|uniref:zinc-finger-containing protein n=1 Tax=Oscillibacter sp. TaxID=1945593 RepID=UPI00259019FC|nr:zinc-finger-containing protein [Oscillibacter sp.]